MWLGQLEEELTCIGSWHCSTSAGAEGWDVSPWGLQPPGKFRWWDSIFFFFPLFPPPVGDVEQAVCIHLVSKILVPDLSNEISLLKSFFPSLICMTKHHLGAYPMQGAVLSSDCYKQYDVLRQGFCFSGPQVFLLQNEGSGSSCQVSSQKQRDCCS